MDGGAHAIHIWKVTRLTQIIRDIYHFCNTNSILNRSYREDTEATYQTYSKLLADELSPVFCVRQRHNHAI